MRRWLAFVGERVCPWCLGTGREPLPVTTYVVPCSYCFGTGKVPQ